MEQLKTKMLDGIISAEPSIKQQITDIVDKTTIEVVSQEEMLLLAGEDEEICYIGSRCYITQAFLELPTLHQQILFFADLLNMFKYTKNYSHQLICREMRRDNLLKITQPVEAAMAELCALGIFDKPNELIYTEKKLPKFRKLVGVFYSLGFRRKFNPHLVDTPGNKIDVFPKNWNFEYFEDNKLTLIIPKLTKQKARIYMERLVIVNDPILGTCEHGISDNRIYKCQYIPNVIVYSHATFKIEKGEPSKVTYYDAEHRQFINAKGPAYAQYMKYARTINELV